MKTALQGSGEFKNFDEEHKIFYAYLEENSGREIKNLEQALTIIDILIVEVREKLHKLIIERLMVEFSEFCYVFKM